MDTHGSGLVLSADRTLDDLTGLISAMTINSGFTCARQSVMSLPRSGRGKINAAHSWRS